MVLKVKRVTEKYISDHKIGCRVYRDEYGERIPVKFGFTVDGNINVYIIKEDEE